MNIVKLQDIKSTHRNPLHSYTLIMRKQKEKLRKQFHSPFGWHHRLNGHEFELALGVGDGQGSLACCSIWGHKESDTTERLN